MRSTATRETNTAARFAMAAVLVVGLALAFWAVLVVHVGDAPAIRNRSGCNIEDAVDGCEIPALGRAPGRDAAAAGGYEREV